MPDAPKVMALAPADWRQLCLLNVAQLHDYVSSIPAHNEAGTSALTDEAMVVIDAHLDRGRAFLTAWRKSRVPGMAAPAKPAERTISTAEIMDGMQRQADQHAAKNGAVSTKKKGGWPLGKPRKPKPQPGAQQ